MAVTYRDLYLDLRREFRSAGFPGAALEARELVAFGAGKTREELRRDEPLYMSPATEERIRALADRHLTGEPVPYILGEWDFFGLTLELNPEVLIPRPDTEVLAEEAIRFLQGLGGECRALDLCAGSGCIGLALCAQVPGARVTLGEKSEGALRICRQNIRRNGLTARAAAVQLDALAAPEHTLGTFQCVACNPPYIPAGVIPRLDVSVRDYEPHMALDGGPDGLTFYRFIAEHWQRALCPGGRLFFEVGAGQAEDVERILRRWGWTDTRTVPDTAGIPRVVSATRPGEPEVNTESNTEE